MSIQTNGFHPQSMHERYASASPLIWLTLILAISMIVLIGIGMIDDQQFNGVNAWGKPAKFALSLGLHGFTLAWGMQYASNTARRSKSVRYAAILFALASIFEMVWITYQASRGEASHFNTEQLIPGIMYGLMGIGSICLTAVTVFYGWKIVRSGNSIMQQAAGYGFILSGVLTTIVAGYMSSQIGHSVGGDATDASGLGLFHWSTTGGDYRPAHFLALHLSQGLPLLGWLIPDRRIVVIGALGSTVLVGLLFAQALYGIPFLAR
jgi:hypothetical protein